MSTESKIREVLSLAHQSVKEAHRDRLKSFLECYCAELPGDFVRATAPHDLLSFTMERFAFLEESGPGQVRVATAEPEAALGLLGAGSTVIEACLPDCTFIVRTIKAFCHSHGLQVKLAIHPVFGVVHDHQMITAIDSRARVGDKTSQIYLLTSRIPEEQRPDYEQALRLRLDTLLKVNEDFQPCLERVRQVRAQLEALSGPEAEEAIELLDWVADNHFIFMGYRYYQARPGDEAGPPPLGLMALPSQAELHEVVELVARGRFKTGEIYSFYRTDHKSVVKSESQLRYVGFKEVDAAGATRGEHVFVGLLSSIGLGEPNKRIPIISRRMQQTLDSLNLLRGTYAYKKVFAILNSMPNEDLFYYNQEELVERVRTIREAEDSDQTRVFIHRRPGMRRISTICIMPRPRFSQALKARVSQAICRFLDVPCLREYVCASEEEGSIRLHFYVSRYRETVTDEVTDELERELVALLATWEERLQQAIYRRYPERAETGGQARYLAIAAVSGPELWGRYAGAFPESYRNSQPPEAALGDLELMEKLAGSGELQVAMTPGVNGAGCASLRIVSPVDLVLNDVVPVLQHMRLRSTGRLSEILAPAGGSPVYLTSFDVRAERPAALEQPDDLERLAEIYRKVALGRLTDDRLLGLGLLCGLDWRQIDLLATYRNYFLQVFKAYARASLDETLLKHHECARLAVDYFVARFQIADPADPAQRTVIELPPIELAYEERTDQVSVIAEDVMLRLFFSLVKNTIRTNYYRGGTEVISIKVDSRQVEHMPLPCPRYEIYVHGPWVEGIHLRGGMVARGGIRHSDRTDDFRTEVLGLMKAQMAKNSIIVPVGSKGGFVTRRTFDDRQQMEQEVVEQYTRFIGGLLDVTDNLKGTEVVPPPGVLRYDGDDPYLVVAADKGTARLSDTANGISQRYGFWLDDAFASGGRAGYDHKAMGITARGAWVNVERHFREISVDIRRQSIRVAGIGDMSGDVFGNGMLLNDRIKLVAAFSHRHIFIDPDPDPAASFAERKRLFELPGSAWSDYDTALLSPGGAVYERAAKKIELSPQALALLRLEPGAKLNGPALIRLVLQLDVELLWFGGIGTYVKAASETDGEVGDRTNDAVRVDAAELRARVVGEGANLGMTARARTAFYLHGGLCNTDAIDNSAGVDCSDHEVNLKILMAHLQQQGAVSGREERDRVLREIEPEVARACLRNNYLQSALVTMEELRSRQDPGSFFDLLATLEERTLDRTAEQLPPDDVLREWHATGKGIPRNVLAVIVSYTKNELYDQVLASAVPDLPFFEPFLASYFPQAIVERYGAQLAGHRLRREIISTVVANALVNQAGSTFLTDLGRESNATLEQLVIRYFVCDELTGGAAYREQVHALDNQVAAAAQYEALMALEQAIEQLARWWGWNENRWALKTGEVAGLQPEFDRAVEALAASLDEPAAEALAQRREELAAQGFGRALAERIARLPLLRHAFEVLAAARDSALSIEEAAAALHELGQALFLDQVDALLAAQAAGSPWERRFQFILEREASVLRGRFLERAGGNGSITRFAAQHHERVERIGDSLAAVTQTGHQHHGQVPLFIILDDYKGLLEQRAERVTRRLHAQ